MTTTPDPTTDKTPAAFIAAEVGLFVGVVMGGLYALLNLSGHADYDLAGDLAALQLAVFGFLFYGVLAFVISWIVISIWRVIRR